MNNTLRFNNKAKDYVKYRPTYPKECIDYLFKKFNLKNKLIADIGSGTGKFTELILNAKQVYAVEPNKDMRKEAEKLLNKNKNFNSINGSAEKTNLDNNSIDIIVSAQAFHWFNLEKSKSEFKRILRKDKTIILIWNSKVYNTSFLKEQKKILEKYSKKNKDKNLVNKFFSNNYNKKSFYHSQEFNLKNVLGRIRSTSYCPMKNTKEYLDLETKITKLFNKYAKNNIIKYNYRCNIYFGKI